MSVVDRILKAREAMKHAKKNGRADVPPEDLEEVEELFEEEDGAEILDATLILIKHEQDQCASRAANVTKQLNGVDEPE